MIYFSKQAFLSDRNPASGPVRSGQADYPSCQSGTTEMSCCLTITWLMQCRCVKIHPHVLSTKQTRISLCFESGRILRFGNYTFILCGDVTKRLSRLANNLTRRMWWHVYLIHISVILSNTNIHLFYSN